jgi:amino acid transporter
MTNRKFNILIFALGVIYAFWATGMRVLAINNKITDHAPILALAISSALPLLAAIWFIHRRYKQFGDDEYQQLRLMRQTYGASLATVVYIAIMGFRAALDPVVTHKSTFLVAIFFWFIGWAIGGFQKADSK